MNIIVTGGSGFLGRHLCRALQSAGHSVKNIDLVDNPQVPTMQADVRDLETMKKLIVNADVVFHLAALIEAGESVKEPQKYVDYNITGTVSVLEAMRINGIKTFIFSSSAAIYGEPQRVPIKEDDRTLPINPYGMTKLAIEGLLNSYVESYEFTGIALRYFNLYGPGEQHQPETHAIPRFVRQVFDHSEVTIWGSGEHQRDYVYIDDIVDAHLKSLTLAAQQPRQYHYFNLSSQQPTAVKDVVALIEQIMGVKANVKNFPPRPGDPLVLCADASKAKAQLGWEAHTKFEDGLKSTIDYLTAHWSG